MRRRVEPYRLTLLVAAYAAALAAAAGLAGERAPLAALPAAAAAAAGVGPWRELLVAALALDASAGPLFYIAALPALAASPMLYRAPPSPARSPLLEQRLPMGPSWYTASKRAAALLAAGLVDPWFAASGLTLLAAASVYTLQGYVKLRASRARLARAPARVVRGSEAYMVVDVWTPGPAWLLYRLQPGAAGLAAVNGAAELKLPLRTGRVGDYNVYLAVHVVSLDGFSQRMILSAVHRYRVIPISAAAAERLGLRLLSLAGRAAGGRVEAALYEQQGPPGRVRLAPRVYPLLRGSPAPGLLEAIYRRVAGASTEAGARRSRTGEYLGARLYVPGDDPRLIHWKKSVSMGRLVVREHSSAGAAAVRGGAGDVSALVADLASSSREELDDVVGTLLAWLALLARRSPDRMIVAVLHYGGSFLVLRGARVDVLREVAAAVSETLPTLPYEYESLALEPPEEALEALDTVMRAAPGVHGIVAARVQGYAQAVVSLLQRSGTAAGRSVVIVHARSTLTRNMLLERRLTRLGFQVSRAGPAASKRAPATQLYTVHQQPSRQP